MSQDKILEELIIQAKALGYDYVDVYVPDKLNDEVVALTFSKSKKYIKKVSEIELEENKK